MNTYPMYVPTTSSGYSPGAMYAYNNMATTSSPMYNIPNTRYNTSNVFTPMTAAHCDTAFAPRLPMTSYDYNPAARTDLRYPQTNWDFSDIPAYVTGSGVPTLMGAAQSVGRGALIGAGTGATLAVGYDMGRYVLNGRP
jgi:hypothetical protein